MTALKAPFPYMGGKSRVARVVWQRLAPFVKRTITISRMTPCAFSSAFRRPSLGLALTYPCFNSAILEFMPMQTKVICAANGLKIRNRIIQLVAVNMMNISTLRYRAVMGFPYHMGTKTPLIRFSDLYKSALLSVALVSCPDSYGSNRNRIVSCDKLTIGISFHSSSITSNYVGDKCRH